MATITRQDQQVYFNLVDRRIAELEREVVQFVLAQAREGGQVTLGQGALYELQREINSLKAQRTRMVTTMTQGTGRTGEVIAQQALFDPDDVITRPRIVVPDRRSGFVLDSIKAELLIRGPIKWLGDMKQGVPPEVARSHTITAMTGTASNLIFEGGRGAALKLITKTEEIEGYIRVTGGKPCDFCAMLSSRGPVYKSRGSAKGGRFSAADADFKVHNHCACTPVPVYDKNMPRSEWPGRAAEFRDLWESSMLTRPSGEVGEYASDVSRKHFRKTYKAYNEMLPPIARNPSWVKDTITLKGAAGDFSRAFVGNVTREAYKATGIKILKPTTYHRLTDNFATELKNQLVNEVNVLGAIPANQVARTLSQAVLTGTVEQLGDRLIRESAGFVTRSAVNASGLPRITNLLVRNALNTTVINSAVSSVVNNVAMQQVLQTPAVSKAARTASKAIAEELQDQLGSAVQGKLSNAQLQHLLNSPKVKKAMLGFTGILTREVNKHITKASRQQLQQQIAREATNSTRRLAAVS